MSSTACFKAYDIRGRVPEELDTVLARRIGAGFAEIFSAHRVIIGHDVRPSSAELSNALSRGLRSTGTDVLDIGLCGTEEIYHAAGYLDADGGIMITASHNPSEYNGLKFVGKGARPINADTGLADLAHWVDKHPHAGLGTLQGKEKSISLRNEYVRDILGFIDKDIILPMNVVANSGNGCASPVFDALAACLPITVTRLAHTPDGSFPNGVPNPLLPENRAITARAVVTTGANIGIAWDGDFDRCFLFDSSGEFVEGYYLVGLLAATMLELHPGSTVIHDPRLVWNTQEIIEMHGGKPVESRCGHAFIKQAMRDVDAVYGGEMSGHHYFRDLFYCDSGMIPWLLVLEIMSRTGAQLSDLINGMAARFPVSGEINRAVNDPTTILKNVESHYSRSPTAVSHFDGLSMEFSDWRFNLRPSNTEPLLRLNVETRGDRELLSRVTNELLRLMSGQAA